MFDKLTPSQFISVFAFRPGRADGSDQLDAVAELTRLNRERGEKGLKPVVPSWL